MAKQDIRILIAPFGWVFVGVYEKSGTTVTLTKASVIRRWGTTKGLGQLIHGPLSETVLDPCGVVDIHEQTVVATIRCEKGWNL